MELLWANKTVLWHTHKLLTDIVSKELWYFVLLWIESLHFSKNVKCQFTACWEECTGVLISP